MASRPESPSMRSSSASLPAPNGSEPRMSRFYSLVMTPINFISFLFSIALVDLQNSHTRFQSHARPRSWLPDWIYEWLHPSPYGEDRRVGGTHWHYHSHQRAIIKMEAEDAFRMRDRVKLLLFLCSIAIIGGILYSANLVKLWFHL